MAGLAESGSNPDVDLLYDINGLAKDAPHWFDRVMAFVGEWGLLLAMVLLAAVVVAICFVWVFPAVAPLMPFTGNTVGQ